MAQTTRLERLEAALEEAENLPEPLQDPEVVRWMEQVRKLWDKTVKVVVSNGVRIGGVLMKLQDRLTLQNAWLDMLKEVEIPQATSYDLIRLARFEQESPDLFWELEALGVSKLEELAGLGKEDRPKLVDQLRRKGENLVKMPFRKFREAVRAYKGGPRPLTPVSMATRLSSRLDQTVREFQGMDFGLLDAKEDRGKLKRSLREFSDALRKMAAAL